MSPSNGVSIDQGLTKNDVDMYSLELNSGDAISIDLQKFNRLFYAHIRLFDSEGNELIADSDSGLGITPRIDNFVAPSDGAYYVGVSSYPNTDYDPNVANSGVGDYEDDYEISIERLDTPVSPSLRFEKELDELNAAIATFEEVFERTNGGRPFDLDSDTVEVQVQATDTGGNSALSNVISFAIVEDTFETVFLCFQIRSLAPKRFPEQQAGRLSENKMREIENAVRYYLDL